MTDNHCGVLSQYKERLRYCTFRSKTILLELPLRLRNIISHFFTRRYWYQIHKFARYLCGWCVYQIVELSLNRSSFFRGCPASFPCRCCCFPWLGPNFPRQLCADDVNLLFTICAGEQFLDDRFLMVFFSILLRDATNLQRWTRCEVFPRGSVASYVRLTGAVSFLF